MLWSQEGFQTAGLTELIYERSDKKMPEKHHNRIINHFLVFVEKVLGISCVEIR